MTAFDMSKLSDAVANATISLVEGWSPAPVATQQPTRLRWGEHDISDAARELRISGDELVITCRGPASDEFRKRLSGPPLRDLIGRPFAGELPDGAQFEAQQAFITDMVITHRDIAFTLHGLDWAITRPKLSPIVWIGRLHGELDAGVGNLTVEAAERWCAGHLLFNGAYRYYLVWNGEQYAGTWFLLVECMGPPESKTLQSEFLLLQFVLGRRLRLDWLAGLESVAGPSAFVGCGLGAIHPERGRRQEPAPLGPHLQWAAPFFTALSRAYRERPELGLDVPIVHYLDSLTDNLDGAYLKLQVGLEAVAAAIVRSMGTGETKKIVANWDDWRRWVEAQRPFVKSTALPGYEKTIMGKLQHAGLAPTGEVVETGYANFSVALIPEMRDELRGRNLAAHRGLMPKPDDRDHVRDLRRIALVRTMLVGLLAKAVGYDGPIVGWERAPGMPYSDAPASWWPQGSAARAEAEKRWVIPHKPPIDPGTPP